MLIADFYYSPAEEALMEIRLLFPMVKPSDRVCFLLSTTKIAILHILSSSS